MFFFTDQLQRTISLPALPTRIISLVPSQTELLFDLGVGERVVGVTKFCVHPAHARKQKAIIGGTKNFHFDRIEALRPDLIIANKEENYQAGIEQLAAGYPVWVSDITTWGDAMQMIAGVGELVGSPRTNALLSDLQLAYEQARQASERAARRRVLYLIWREPYMSVGKDTFIHTMLDLAGFENVCEGLTRYPEVSAEAMQALRPDVILLSSEPYPFKAKHIQELQAICPTARVELTDGEMFSWYGSRLREGLEYVRGYIEE